jgi:hypothetical protein
LRSSGLLTFKDLAQNQSFSQFSLVFSARHTDAFKRVLSGKRAAQLPTHSRHPKNGLRRFLTRLRLRCAKSQTNKKRAQPKKKKKGGMRLLRTHHTHHHSATERQLITISV